MRKYFIALLLLLSVAPLQSRSWADLYSDDKEIYGSEKDEKFPVAAYLWELERWEGHYSNRIFYIYKHTDYPKYSSTRLFPFYSHTKSKIDNRERIRVVNYYSIVNGESKKSGLFPLVFWGRDRQRKYFHVFPIFYSSFAPYSSTVNVLGLFYNNKKPNRSKGWLFPLYYYKSSRSENGKKGYYNVLFLHHSWHSVSDDTKSKGVAGPLYFFYREKGPQGEVKHNYILNTAWGHGKDYRYFHFFPFYFSYSSPEKKSLNIMLIFNRQTVKNETTTMLFPLYLSYKREDNGKVEKYFNILYLFHNYRNDFENSSLKAGPLYYFSKKENNGIATTHNYLLNTFWGRGEKSRYLHVLPFYFSYQGENSGFTNILGIIHRNYSEQGSQSWVLPFYYNKKVKGKYSYTNVLGLYNQVSKNGETDLRWVLPVYFYKKDRYRHIVPLYFSGRTATGNYTAFLPFYARLYKEVKSKDGAFIDKTVVTPLWYHKRKTFETRYEEDEISSTFFFPIIPVYFQKRKNGTTHRNLLYLADWEKDELGLKRLWLMPLVFYKRNSYLHVFPFYFRPNAYHAQRGVSFGPLHYHRWSPEKKKLWLLLHYSSVDYNNDTYQWHLFPLYYKWKTEKSSGHIFLPLFANYKDEHRSFHVNLLGIAKSMKQGLIQPRAGFNDGYREWYLDVDISWFYSLFRYSRRVTGPTPFFGKSYKEETAETKQTDSVPSIQKQHSLSREDARDYTGYKLLFGLWSYEKADSKRHLRILPLSWLTWDQNSDNKLFVIPFPVPIVWYQAEKSHYRVIFPFYASQSHNGSYVNSWLLFAYIRSYDAEKDKHSVSVLWPLINYYHSPQESGSRILPFYIYKRTSKEGLEEKKFYSLFYYSVFSKKNNVTLKKTMFPLILPLVYSRERTEETEGLFKKEKSAYIFPIYYSAQKESVISGKKEYSARSFSLLHYKSEKNSARVQVKRSFYPLFLPLVYSSKKRETAESYSIQRKTNYIFPFYFHSSSEVASPIGREKKTLAFSLLHYKRSHVTPDKVDKTLVLFPLFYYKKETEKMKYWSWLFVFHGRSFKDKSSEKSSFTLFPFWFSSATHDADKDEKSLTFLPFFHKRSYRSGSSDYSRLNILGFINLEKDRIKQESSVLVFPFYYRKKSASYNRTNILGFVNIETKSSPFYSRKKVLVFPFYNSVYWKMTDEKSGLSEVKDTYVLYIYRNRHESFFDGEGDNRKKVTRKLSWLLPLYFHDRSWSVDQAGEKNIYSKMNILGLFYREKRQGRVKKLWLFPLYFYNNYGRSQFIAGLYLIKRENYFRANFLYLVDYEHDRARKRKKLNLFFGMFHYEKSPNRKKVDLFYGYVGSFTKGQGYYRYRMLWMGVNRRGENYYTANFIPFYYYKKRGRQRIWIIPPLLTYINKNPDKGIELGGLGLFWYRKYDKGSGKDTKRALLGILYTEKHRRERGYSSYSSMGGVLWRYQKETETGYSKFTVLMLFGKIKKGDQTWYKVFGVNIKKRKKTAQSGGGRSEEVK